MTENQGVSTWPAEYQPQIKRNAFAGFSRHWTEQYQQPAMKQGEMVWVHKRHCPDDARSVFPTRATKPNLGQYPAPQPVPKYWVQTPHAQLGAFSRQAEEDRHFRSCQGKIRENNYYLWWIKCGVVVSVWANSPASLVYACRQNLLN